MGLIVLVALSWNKSEKLPSFMATQKIPEYEQLRNENVRRNNELLASLHIPPIGPQPTAPSKRQRCSSIPRMVEANRDTTVMTRKGRGKLMAAATLALDSSTSTQHADIPCNEAVDDVEEGEEEEEGSDTQQTKRTGRGPAKGSKGYGTKGVIFRKRIISTDAARSIWPLFRSELTGPYTTFKKCPQHYLDKLFKLFKNKNFKFDCNEGEVKHAFEAYIENNYKNWMSAIRNSVFRIHKTAAARYANNPSYVPPHNWTLMVDDWLKPTWQEMSDQNKLNRDKLNLVHTTGSVPMAKYIYAEIERTGVEPSPIEMFRRFHVTAGKDGEEERWRR
ncbi:uncharacterized protein LOC126790376 isoform X2 [Argentina anserina]|uniref:uncharacterized protein LOC126790376 isoform X2 n=1 Tax=Argentina anserina TaxID=57926 RepID=UPI0021764B09|nr:uncharacterized protein LOC126790376 isoform X2 [Potentilla anserina]